MRQFLIPTRSLLEPSSDSPALPPHGDGDQGDQALWQKENRAFPDADNRNISEVRQMQLQHGSNSTNLNPSSVKFDECKSNVMEVRQM